MPQLEKLIQYWLKRLTRFAYYQLDPDLKRSAVDVAHDALAICWRRLADGAWTCTDEDGIERLGPSLYRTTRQLVMNMNRKHRPRAEADFDSELLPLSCDDHDPAASAENAERRGAVQAALMGLREPFREVVVLRYLEGHSEQEVARILDIPLGTVKSRSVRGLNMLRRKLAHWFADEDVSPTPTSPGGGGIVE